jgi:hypothetical protein
VSGQRWRPGEKNAAMTAESTARPAPTATMVLNPRTVTPTKFANGTLLTWRIGAGVMRQ